MTEQIQAIQTFYDGYRFRSRLEARWAVFFDAAHIEYQYEPEGFKTLEMYSDAKAYLPDFYLPQWDIYAEVKPTDEALKRDAGKIGDAIDFHASPISDKGLLLLGNIPYMPGCMPVFRFLYWKEGVASGKALFDIWDGDPVLHTTGCDYEQKGNIELYGINESWASFGEPIPEDATVVPEKAEPRYMTICTDTYYINKCFEKARQARFEHGETPEDIS